MLPSDDLTVAGLAVLQIQFFQQQRNSLLMASGAVAALQSSTGEAEAQWAGGEGDLDFVLYDSRADPVVAKGRDVYYRFLSARPMPSRRVGETVAERAQVLKGWMEACYLQHNRERLSNSLRTASSSLAAEFDTVLNAVAAPCGRRVSGAVVPAANGGSVVALVVPLLGARDEDVRRTLTEASMLYAKALRCPWEANTHTITSAEFDLHVRFHCSGNDGEDGNSYGGGGDQQGHTRSGRRAVVLAEHLSASLVDTCEVASSYTSLLQCSLNLLALPQCKASFEKGDGFAQYLPLLDDALYRCLREPLHFLKLCVALSASFGEPVDVTAAVYDPESGSLGPAQMRGASYCVADKASQCSFTIGLHYYGGDKLPSVGVVCSQYLSRSHDSLLRMKISYPTDAEKSLSMNADGMFDIKALSAVIATSTMETMAFLCTQCQ